MFTKKQSISSGTWSPRVLGAKKQILLLCCVLSAIVSFQCWEGRVGGGSGNDYGYCIVYNYINGARYVMAGQTYSFGAGGSDVYVVRFPYGLSQWTRTIGGAGDDAGYSIVSTPDSGYAVAGVTNSFGYGGEDVYVIKLDGEGVVEWTRTVGGSYDDAGRSIVRTADGGYVIAGYTASFGSGSYNVYVLKLNAAGTLQWTRTVGGANDDRGYAIANTPDGGYVIAGSTMSFGAGNADVYVVKLDTAGTLEWTRTVGGANDDRGYAITNTTDGGYCIAGYTMSFGAGNADFYIVRLNYAGTVEWTRTIGGTNDDRAYSIASWQSTYRVVGYSMSFGIGGKDIYIIQLGTDGGLQAARTYGKSGEDCGYSAIYEPGQIGFVMLGAYSSGINNSDVFAMGGGYLEECGYPASGTAVGSGGVSGTGGTLGSSGGYVVSNPGIIGSGGTFGPMSGCLTGMTNPETEVPISYMLYQNYPNPFNPVTKIKFSIPPYEEGKGDDVRLVIYDMLGREVATLVNEQLKPGSYEIDWDASIYSSGIYFYKLSAEDFSEVKKMILLK